ncbi:MAG: lipid carrier protein [Alphaproteobacteria bacterium]|jgi:O2-independent ubiquinone biosynthesis accessory factor UbiT|nr:lipid carrier protein [Alphaproteobacteria bacterium]MBT7944028.1 lipid carrier protein [Alphaproteobacteria bacterium]
MHGPTHDNPPLIPVFLAGIALKPLPPILLQPVLDATMAVLSKRHPGLFARLKTLQDCLFIIDPVDLPFDFLLRVSTTTHLRAIAKNAPRNETPTATIRGSLTTLTQLLEGRLDGDALFFSRDLMVEGNMEAVVMLRNAVDGAGVDLRTDLLSAFGPLRRPVGRLADGALRLFTRMERDLESLKRALTAPVAERCQAQATEIRALRETVEKLQRTQASVARSQHTASAKAQSR